MKAFEAVRVGMAGLGVHKVRSTLSMLGIIFGVASVVAVISVSEGARHEMLKQLAAMGADNIMVRSRQFAQRTEMKKLRLRSAGLSVDDGEAVAGILTGRIRAWAPLNKVQIAGLPVNVRVGGEQVKCEVVGTSPDFLKVSGFLMAAGRFIVPEDEANCTKVCVLEEALREEIFPLRDAIGGTVYIDADPYAVVGVLKRKETTEKKFEVVDIKALNRRVYVPLSASLYRMSRDRLAGELDEMIFRTRGGEDLYRLARHIDSVMALRHHVADLARGDRDYEVSIAIDLVRQTQKSQEIFDWVLRIGAGISLLVGGIGIMNIMLANVSERRREIGIRRAVGATQMDILQQFVLEALGICLFGGLMGLAVGMAFTWGVAKLTDWKTVLSLGGMTISLSFSIVDGLLFGTYPAYKAARLDPIDALRYE